MAKAGSELAALGCGLNRLRVTAPGPDRVKTQQAMAINYLGIFSVSRRPSEAQSGAIGDSGCYGTVDFGALAGGQQES